MSPEAEATVAYARTLGNEERIPIAVRVLLELADARAVDSSAPRLLTTSDLARRYSVAESTARAWLADGLAPGAEKFAAIGWRLPPDALPALEANLRERAGDTVDLSAWRRTRRPAA